MPSSGLRLRSPILAGTVASITGQAASTGVVLAALSALGASQAQIVSVVFVMLLLFGALSIVLSWRYKMPISIVWSTPGAALLVSAGGLGFGFETVVGAFIVASLLIALTGLWPALGRLVSSIPKPIASAMLAGVIFSFCIAPFSAAGKYPLVVLPALAVWLVLYKLAQVWATPISMVVLFGLTAAELNITIPVADILPAAQLVAPQFSLVAIISIGLPLYLVTMASQNIPGIAIMKSFGYEVPFRPVMLATGLGSLVSNLFGGFLTNLAAITAALNANEQAHRDPSKRWIASVSGGVVYLLLALTAGASISFVIQAPREIILAGAGLALFATMMGALSSIVEEPDLRLPAVIAFLVASSGFTAYSIGPAFWALVAGVLVWLWLAKRKKTAA
jgi:benzoate membrane transport protein